MKELEDQKFLRRYARQDYNKNRIEQFNKLLDEAIQTFGVCFFTVVTCLYLYSKPLVLQLGLQISVHRLHTETFQRQTAFQLELDDVSRERHDEVLDVSRMSESEREVRAVNGIFIFKIPHSTYDCSSSLRKYLRRVVRNSSCPLFGL
jgi:hypothetical protein